MKEDKDFLQWYRSKVRENAQDPPEEVWENISNQLDVNDVWDRVSEELDEKDKMLPGPRQYYYAAAILILLAVVGGIINLTSYTGIFQDQPDSTNNKQEITAEMRQDPPVAEREQPPIVGKENNKDAVSKATSENSQLKQPKGSGVDEENVQLDKPAVIAEQRTNNSTEVDGAKNQIQESSEIVLGQQKSDLQEKESITKQPGNNSEAIAYSNMMPPSEKRSRKHDPELVKAIYPSFAFHLPDGDLQRVIVPLEEEQILNLDSSVAILDEKEQQFYKSFDIGLTGSVKNIWLLNKATYIGLEKHTLTATIADFGKDLGLIGAYTFSNKLGIQGEVFLLAEKGQKYKEYLNGKYVTREIDLNYYSFNLLLNYNLNKRNFGSSLIIGGYGSILKTAYEVVDDKATDQSSNFLKHDFGAVIGYEFNRQVMENLIFTTGLRFNYGLMNIYNDKFNPTTAGSLALNFAFKYRIKQQQQ